MSDLGLLEIITVKLVLPASLADVTSPKARRFNKIRYDKLDKIR